MKRYFRDWPAYYKTTYRGPSIDYQKPLVEYKTVASYPCSNLSCGRKSQNSKKKNYNVLDSKSLFVK